MELPPPGGAWRRVEERPVLWSWMRWALLICARGNIADQGRHAGVRSRKDQRQKTGCRVPRSSIRPMRPHAPAPRLLEPPSAAGGGFFSAPPAGGHARSPGAGQRFPVESPPPLRARALPLLQAPCELPGRRSHVGHAACRLSGCPSPRPAFVQRTSVQNLTLHASIAGFAGGGCNTGGDETRARRGARPGRGARPRLAPLRRCTAGRG